MPLQFNFSFDQVIKDYNVERKEIEELKLWLESEKLPKFTKEQVLVFFLSCDKDRDGTKVAIQKNVSLVAKMPEIFTNRDADEPHIQQYLSISNICLMPQRTEDGCIVIYCKLIDFDYRNFDFASCFAVWIMCLESGIYDYPPTGCVYIADSEGLSFMHLSKIKLQLAKLLSQYFQEGLHVKLKVIHVLNSSWVSQKLLALLQPVMKVDVFDKINLHSANIDMETFYKNHVPKRCLPLECGGDLPSMKILYQRQVEKLRSMQDYFYHEEQIRKNIV